MILLEGFGKKLNNKNIKVEDQCTNVTKWVQRHEKSNTVPSVQPKVQQLFAMKSRTPPPPPGMEAPVQEIRPNSGNTTVWSIQNPPNDWSPLDDDIKVYLPSPVSTENDDDSNNMPSKEDVDLHIQEVLFGSSQKKRLEVFTKICPVFNHI
ncbi:hypothetical protein LIER_10438 [Lithospermum erythrorhizon]|uniref:Uncharacterized protein n=1 Tax=Lithospermum erythrorhizon TaxID=34254 RepID=A0AAV3PJC0_LITER